MLQAIRDDAQRQSFHSVQSLFSSLSVNHDSRKRGDIGDPPSVRFPVELYFEVESCGLGGALHANSIPSIRIIDPGILIGSLPIFAADSGLIQNAFQQP
jgi:hypothetical protein